MVFGKMFAEALSQELLHNLRTDEVPRAARMTEPEFRVDSKGAGAATRGDFGEMNDTDSLASYEAAPPPTLPRTTSGKCFLAQSGHRPCVNVASLCFCTYNSTCSQ